MFEIGQIFIGEYPVEAARYCNQHNLRMMELPPLENGMWRFQIQECVPEQAAPAMRIAEAQAYLDSTDWYVIRQTETGVAVPEDVTARRQQARDAIDCLRAEL